MCVSSNPLLLQSDLNWFGWRLKSKLFWAVLLGILDVSGVVWIYLYNLMTKRYVSMKAVLSPNFPTVHSLLANRHKIAMSLVCFRKAIASETSPRAYCTQVFLPAAQDAIRTGGLCGWVRRSIPWATWGPGTLLIHSHLLFMSELWTLSNWLLLIYSIIGRKLFLTSFTVINKYFSVDLAANKLSSYLWRYYILIKMLSSISYWAVAYMNKYTIYTEIYI